MPATVCLYSDPLAQHIPACGAEAHSRLGSGKGSACFSLTDRAPSFSVRHEGPELRGGLSLMLKILPSSEQEENVKNQDEKRSLLIFSLVLPSSPSSGEDGVLEMEVALH